MSTLRTVRCGLTLSLAVTLSVGGVPCGTARRATAAEGRVQLSVVDHDTGQPVAARLHLKDAQGQPVRTPQLPWWHDHVVFDGQAQFPLTAGSYSFELDRGPEYQLLRGKLEVDGGQSTRVG